MLPVRKKTLAPKMIFQMKKIPLDVSSCFDPVVKPGR